MKMHLFILVCISCICIGCGKKEKGYGVETRPEDFPEILVPLDGAIDVRYLSPETSDIVEGTYSVYFWIDEEYPASKTIEQIQNHLKSQDCVRVRGSVLSDLTTLHVIEGEGFNKKVVDMSNEFRQDLKKTQIPTETQWRKPNPLASYAEYKYSTWSEEWITPEDDKISIILEYDIHEGEEKLNELYVYLAMFTPNSWMYPHVQRYKENHPEEFQDPNETKTKSPGE